MHAQANQQFRMPSDWRFILWFVAVYLVLFVAIVLFTSIRNTWEIRLALLAILALNCGLWSLAARRRRKRHAVEREFRAAVVQIEMSGIGACLFCVVMWSLEVFLPTLGAAFAAMFTSTELAYYYKRHRDEWVKAES